MEVEMPRRAESQVMEVPELDGVVLNKEQAHQLKLLLTTMCLICRDVAVPDKLLEALVRLRDENCRNAEQGMQIIPEEDGTGRSSQGEFEEFSQIEERRQLMPNFEAALERLKLNSSNELQKIEKSRRQLKYKRRVRELEGPQELHPEEYIELNTLKLIEMQKRVRSELVSELHLKQNCSRPDSCLFDWGLMRTRYHLLSFLGENYPLSYSGSEEMRKRRDAERQKRLEQEDQARTLARKRKFFCELSDFAKEFQLRMSTFKRIRKLLTDGVVNWHTKKKKKASMAERMRVIALKTDDQEAYMKLVEESKNERLTTLLSKTDELLQKLGAMVQLQKDADPEDAFTKKDKHKDRNKDQGKDGQAKSKQGDAPAKGKENASDVPVKKVESTKRDYLEGQRQYNSAVHQIEEQVTEQPALLQGGQLRIYQLEGLQWMLSLYNNNLNGILADEMGLGKTIQTIALFAYLMENKNLAGPHIVVAPKAVIPNWASEFATWLPSAITVVYDGRSEERRLLREQHAKEGSFNVLLTHYDLVMRDRQFLKRYRWNYMVVDEGHRLKNHDCQLARTLASGYHIRRRLLLTGTPIQNHLQELWSLLNFILPAIFNSSANFEEWFNAPFADRAEVSLTEEEQLLIIRRLHQVLRPFLLRRKKSEVEKYLPSKRQVILKCDLSAWQKQYYKQIIDDGRVGLLNGTGRSKSLQNTAMHLRKCCNHPYLFLDPDYEPATADEIVRASGKFELLDRLLPKLQKTGHRVLLFSQMTRLIDIMERFLTMRGFNYLRLDGGTKTEDRGRLLKLFNAENSPYFMFLLSTRAGGLGLNLQTADTVIMFDSDWNPQMDQQAEDRAHRIGQKKEVQVFILVSVGSIEEEILERAKSKMGIDAKVIQAGLFNTTSTAAERREMLETIMRRGTDEFSKDVPSEQEINHLTARPEELELYEYMDAERRDKEGYRPRLMQEHEVPEWVFIRADESALGKEETPLEGKRKRKEVQYSDILSDSQWLKAVEDGQDVEEITKTEISRRSRRDSSSVTPQKIQTKSKLVLKLRTRYSEVASTSVKSSNSQDEADSVSEEAPASTSEDKEESSGSQVEWKKVKRRRSRFCTADSGDEEQHYSEEEESYEKKVQESRSSRKRGRTG